MHLALAREQAADSGRPALAAHFARKEADEVGHDHWAERDVSSVGALFGIPGTHKPARAISDLVGYLERSIRGDSKRYLAYILFAEYFTVLVGPEWLDAMERCGVPLAMMSSVGNHVELDQAHVREGLREIDLLVGPEDRDALLQVLHRAMDHCEAFFDELAANVQ